MKYRLYNAKILLNNKLSNGEVWVFDDKIAYVGKPQAVVETKFDKEYDLQGKLIMPGLVDMYYNSSLTFARNLSNNNDFNDTYYSSIQPIYQQLTDDDSFWVSLFGIKELVRNGITTCLDVSNKFSGPYKAYDISKYRAVMAINPSTKFELNNNSNISFCVKINSYGQVCEDDITKAIKFARENNLVLCLSTNESLDEMGDCNKRENCTPIQYFDSFGVFDSPCVCFQCVHLEDCDYDILNQKDVSTVICNSSNLKNGSGVPLSSTLIKRGINVCLGSDSALKNSNIDMFKEMFLAIALNKGMTHDIHAINSCDVLNMVNKNSFKALNMGNLGELKEGNFADLLVLNINEPNYFAEFELGSDIIYSANGKDVSMTMVNGNILYKDGQYNLGIDEKTINNNYKRIITKIKKLQF